MNKPHAFDLSAPVNTTDHQLGPAHVEVTVVEYGDFECPNCKQAAPAVKLMLARFAGHARLVYRHFPLEEVHPHALLAAQAAESAGVQGKFWEMHDLLFGHQEQLALPHLRSYAQQLQLDLRQFDACMDDGVYLQRVREHQRSGHDSGVRHTPTFFVNGQVQDVSFGMKSLLDAVGAALGRPK